MGKRDVTVDNYFDVLSQKEPLSVNPEKVQDLEQLCKIALETRSFEIKLYWQRTTYYWAFIAADIAAYALVYSKIESFSTLSYALLAILSVLGILFSCGWLLANRGSKFWQENWEGHMGLLIRAKYGPIFQTIALPKSKGFWGTGGYPYSVSRVNQWISIFVLFMWIGLFSYPFCKLLGLNLSDDCIDRCQLGWILLGCALVGCIILFRRTRSKHFLDYKSRKKKAATATKQEKSYCIANWPKFKFIVILGCNESEDEEVNSAPVFFTTFDIKEKTDSETK